MSQMVEKKNIKPLGIKNYGSIGHLPNSRMGPADHHVHEGQAVICTQAMRDCHDCISVTEKLDGSNVGVAVIGGNVVALGRAGWLADTSPFEQHRMFAEWVRSQEGRFLSFLGDGERCVGEWLAQAHGTRYQLKHEPFVVFDIMRKHYRIPYGELKGRCLHAGFVMPAEIHCGGPISVEYALALLGAYGRHGAIDPVEGAVWRVERKGEFDFMAKFVRTDKQDGIYLAEVSGKESVWNWRAGAAGRGGEVEKP